MHRTRTLAAGCALTLAAAPLTIATTAGSASAQHVTPARVAGENRYATAAEVARFLYPDGVSEALLGSGTDFPDALAGAPLAGANSSPVLLTDPDTLSDETADVLADLGVNQVTLLGGPNAISPAVAQDLESQGYVVGRVAGQDRFETAAELARAVYAENTGANFPGDRRAVFVANGLRFPDALAASAPASMGPAQIPIVLVEQDRLPGATAQVLADLDVELAILVGGTAAISASVRQAIEDRGVSTDRIDGQTRTDTARNVAAFAQEFLGFDATSHLLARGEAFPDALAAGPLGGVRQDPILLTEDPNTLSSPTSTFLAEQCPDVEVVRAVGGTSAVSAEVLSEAEQAAESCEGGEPGRTQQSYIQAPQEARTGAPGTSFEVTVSGFDSAPAPVDIALFPCAAAAPTDPDDNTFADGNNDGFADGLGTTATNSAVIGSVHAANSSTRHVDAVEPNSEGRIPYTLHSDAEDCVVNVVFHDANENNQLDVDAEGRPREHWNYGLHEWQQS